jgi:hypothetical protein
MNVALYILYIISVPRKHPKLDNIIFRGVIVVFKFHQNDKCCIIFVVLLLLTVLAI